jgi:two-component system response regulator FixJ
VHELDRGQIARRAMRQGASVPEAAGMNGQHAELARPVPVAVPHGVVHVVAADPDLRREVAAALRDQRLEVREFCHLAGFVEQAGTPAAGCVVTVAWKDDAAGLVAQLADRGCVLPVVVVVQALDVPAAVRAMKAGAADVVARPFAPADLAAAVCAAIAAREAATADPVAAALHLRFARLTRRERQVLDAIVRGEANKGIATCLGISPRTVEVHRAKVMEKLACRNLPDLVRLAIRAGMAAR